MNKLDVKQMKKLRKNIIVILGNGFDLDLGLKTSYKEFWQERNIELTSYRYYISPSEALYSRLEEHHKNMVANNWFDFEEIMRSYASETIKRYESRGDSLSRTASYHGNNLKANIEYFIHLKKTIIDYISIQQDNHNVRTESHAASLLRVMAKKSLFRQYTCYNFNYTNINIFAKELGYKNDLTVKYIHGNLQDKNIIFGIGEDQLVNGYDFLLKKNQGAKGMLFQEELYKADEVIIFGLAFGRNDIHYFIDFFKSIQSRRISPKITIYTYNEQEKENIKHRLAEYSIDLSIIMSMKILTMISTHD